MPYDAADAARSRMSKLEKLSFNDVLKWHALAAGPAGLVLVMLPHRLFAQLSGAPYSPAAHEVARCYGALTAAQAWFAWRTWPSAMRRVRRMLAEAYAPVSYTHLRAHRDQRGSRMPSSA